MSKLLILHCLCPPISDGYLVHESKVGSTCAGCVLVAAPCQWVKESAEHACKAWISDYNRYWYLYTHILICKTIQQKMKKDIGKHDEKQIIEAIENSKSLNQARQKQRLRKGQLISIVEEDVTNTHGKDRIVKRCVQFYEELYRSRRASADHDAHNDPTTTSTIVLHPYYHQKLRHQ